MGFNDEKNSGIIVDHIQAAVLQEIEKAAHGIEQGSITLIVQDTRLIQMDVVRRVQFLKQQGKQPLIGKLPAESQKLVGQRIVDSLKGMRYGQVALLVKQGRIVQVERTEKQRLPIIEGAYGAGI